MIKDSDYVNPYAKKTEDPPCTPTFIYLNIHRCGKKMVAGTCGLFSAVAIVFMPLLGNSALAVVVMVTVGLAFTSLSGASLSSIVVDLFPTSLRYGQIYHT